MKYLCVKVVKNEAVKNGKLIWVESFMVGQIYSYAGNGIMLNQLGQAHRIGRWFKFWHFSKLSKRQELADDIKQNIFQIQQMIVGLDIEEKEFRQLSLKLSDAWVKSVLLKVELNYLW